MPDSTSNPAIGAPPSPHEHELTDFFENASIPFHWVGADGTILRANRAELELLGFSQDEYIGRHIAEFHVDRPVIDDILARLSRGETLQRYPARLRCRNGAILHVLINSSALFENGRFVHTRCVTIDVTEQRQAEDALRQSEARFRALAESLPVLIANCDTETRFKFVNPPYAERFGLQPGDVIGRRIPDVLGEGAYAAIQPYVAEVLNGRAVEYEIEVPYRTGGHQFMRCAYTPERDEHGRVVGWFAALINVTDRRRAHEQLRASEERYRRLTELLPVAMYTCEAPSGTITYYNEHAARIWGRAPRLGDTDERFCGSFRLFLPDGTFMPHEACPMAVTLREGQSFRNCEVSIERPDGSRATVLVNVDPIHDAGGRVVGAINVFHDVTALKEAEQALREADRRKDEFLATLSHELRNPLAPIRMALSILARTREDPVRFDQTVAVMERQLAQHVKLIDDLLDVSRISRGKLQLRPERVELGAVVRHAVETARLLAEPRQPRIELTIPDEAIEIDADPVRLGQILHNLLNNACKYTAPDGTIRVTAARLGPEALVTVRDTGIGIAHDQLEAIFEMFAQGDPSLEHPSGGLGIGLSLARRLVELHGGTIVARSDGLGHGSEFIVRLPLPVDAARPTPSDDAIQPEPIPGQGPGRRILVVDDNVDAADMLVALLEMHGHLAETAHDGRAALERAEAFRPAVVLLDIGLPFADGYEVCRAIREQPWGRSIIMVALTGWGQDEDRRKSSEAGFDAHLTKPIAPETVLRVIDSSTPSVLEF